MTRSTASILFVESYPHAMAGQQETLKALLAGAPEMGLNCRILLPGDGVYVQHLRDQGRSIDIVEQPSTTSTYGGAVYDYNAMDKIKMVMQVVRYIGRLRRYLRDEKFKAVYCNDMRGLLTVGVAARLAGLPVMIWDKLDKPHGLYDALQLPLASRNLMITQSVSKKYPSWQKRLWRKKMKVINNGIDIARFQSSPKASARNALGLKGDDIAACIVGTISERKGHDILMSAFKDAKVQNSCLKLFVIGTADNETKDFADDLKASAPDGVTWLGYRTDVEQLIPAFDMILSPSRYEGMGRVNVEAMAAGVPVVGTRETGIAEVVVHGETGFLIDQEDVNGLREAIVRLADNASLRTDMGQASKERAETYFDGSKQIEKVLQEIKDLAIA